MTTGASISAPRPSPPNRRRRWMRLVVATALAVTASVGGWMWWHGRQPTQRFARALTALDAQRFDEVRRELSALETFPGCELQQHFLRGALLLQDERFFPALDEFGHTVDDPNLRLRTLTLAGQALYRVQDFQAAIGLLVQVVHAAPEAVDAQRWLAAAYYDLGRTDEAMRHLAQVAELDPADARPHRLMGLIQKDFENYVGAVESYRESLRRNGQQPDREAIRQELAECQLKLRQPEDALQTLAESRPGPDRWALEADCHYGAGRPDEARRLLDETLRAAPANLRALLLRGTIALEEGDAEMAVKVLSQAVAAYPKDHTARFKLERAYRRLGDGQHADEQAHIAGEIQQLRRQFAKLHETAAAEPNNADVRCQLGVLARQLDRPDLARVWFQAALAIEPRHPETLRQISDRPQPK
ncbi:MAG: tetratricopeptide repeat protein [Planctomycetota bacterium]|nr:tetratricopeptide repeat protein [Planctomycetota bacterium]